MGMAIIALPLTKHAPEFGCTQNKTLYGPFLFPAPKKKERIGSGYVRLPVSSKNTVQYSSLGRKLGRQTIVAEGVATPARVMNSSTHEQ